MGAWLQARVQRCWTQIQGATFACGYAQLFGVDYLDTYASVVKHYCIRLVLAIVALQALEMIQLDIKIAFLYGELEEELYLQQPEGYVIPGK